MARHHLVIERWIAMHAKRPLFAAGMIAVLLLLTAIGPRTQARSRAFAPTPAFEEIPCPRFVTAAAETDLTCGHLIVPEDRSDPADGTIELFVTIASPADGPTQADPIFGIGRELNWTNPAARPGLTAASSGRVQVNIDPRGAGYSQPNLRCPEVRALTLPETGITLGTPAMEDALVDAAQACHDRLAADGVDLADYNVAEMAADVEDLRIALGYDSVNLLTYGTASEVLYEVLRTYPDHIRSAVLDSPQAPNVDRFTQAVVGTEDSLHAVF